MKASDRVEIPEKALDRIKELSFWFVDIPRTSSTSIKHHLSRKYGSVFGKTGRKQGVIEGWVPDHTPASVIRNQLGADVWDEMFTFTVVRNPWDRMLSMYRYRKQLGVIDEGLSFASYLKKLKSRDTEIFSYHGHYLSCMDFIKSDNGEVLVTKIVQFENRRAELKSISRAVGVPELRSSALHLSRTRHQHYSNYFTAETRELIAELFEDDIRAFGYTFGSARGSYEFSY